MDCFFCGSVYEFLHSTAPEDYKGTYCSLECYTTDMTHMKNYSDEAQATVNVPAKQSVADSTTTEMQIGQFRIKVRKTE